MIPHRIVDEVEEEGLSGSLFALFGELGYPLAHGEAILVPVLAGPRQRGPRHRRGKAPAPDNPAGLLDSRRRGDVLQGMARPRRVRADPGPPPQVGAIPRAPALGNQLSGGQRQSVAVGRAVAWGHHIVLLDEPAAALGVEQTDLVLGLIRRLRAEGVAVVLISHNMHDVLEVCDRAVILRHGLKVAQLDDFTGVTTRHLVDLITGTALGEADVARHTEVDRVRPRSGSPT